MPRLVAPKSAMPCSGLWPEQGNAPLGLLSPQRVPLCGAPMHWLAMTSINLLRVRTARTHYRGKFLPVCGFTQQHLLATAEAPPPFAFHRAKRPCNRRSPSVFCMSLRGAGRGTWQSVLLAVVLNEKQYPRQIRNHLRIRPEYCVFFPISAGRGLPHQ